MKPSRSVSRDCEHLDVRYFKAENGAVACMICGRLFGHLCGDTFTAHNPTKYVALKVVRP